MNNTKDQFTLFTTCNVAEISFGIPNLFRDGKHENHRIAVLVINSMLCLSTILLNGISIITIRKTSQLKSKVCYFVVLLQSAVDFGVGAIGIPAFICYLIFLFADNTKCIFITLAYGTLPITCSLSIVTLSAMTVERYIGVLHPYRYKTMVTKKRVFIYACGNAVILLLGVAYSFSNRSAIKIAMMTYVVLNLFFNAFAYTRIYLVVRKLIRSEQKPVGETNGNQNVARKNIFREIRHAKSCFLVLICFIVFLLPFMLRPVLLTNESVDFSVYTGWTLTLLFSNSSVNSVIFFWTKTLLRNEAFKVIKSLRS